MGCLRQQTSHTTVLLALHLELAMKNNSSWDAIYHSIKLLRLGLNETVDLQTSANKYHIIVENNDVNIHYKANCRTWSFQYSLTDLFELYKEFLKQ